jgi:hypothetical protein
MRKEKNCQNLHFSLYKNKQKHYLVFVKGNENKNSTEAKIMARFEEGNAYRVSDSYGWGWSCELVCVKRNAKSIRFHDAEEDEYYTFKLLDDGYGNEEVKCGEVFGHNWLSAEDIVEDETIRILG